ncbi:MAG TPA: hypothetical protein VGK59_18140 [Ohtaekwangia sp.]
MKQKINSSLLGVIVLLSLSVVSISCGDDDDGDVNCNKIYSEIGDVTGDLLSEDCEVVIDAYTELIDLYDKGRDCDAIEEAIEDEGYDSVDEWIEELEGAREDVEDDCV